MRELKYQFVLIYLDDRIIFSESNRGYLRSQRIVFG